MHKIRLGFIGLGHVGQIAHFKNYLYNDDVTISGICDSRLDLVQKIQKKYNVENIATNADLLIHDKNIDALVIVVDRGSVFSLSKKALEARKHVFTEKPMALNSINAQDLVNLANKNNVIYKIGFMRKYDVGISNYLNNLKDLISDKKLGRLGLLRIHAFDSVSSYAGGHDSTPSSIKKDSSDPLIQVPAWVPLERKMDYLNTLNVYCHHLNLLNSIFDASYSFRINYVNFKMRHCRIVNLTVEKKEVTHEIILELGNIPSIVHDEYIEASFEGGVYRVDFPPNMLKDGVAVTSLNEYGSESQQIRKNYFPYSWSFRNQSKDFINDIKFSREKYINSGTECLRDMALHDKLWEWEIR